MNNMSYLDMRCASVWVDKLRFPLMDALAFITIEAKKWLCSIHQIVILKYVTRVCYNSVNVEIHFLREGFYWVMYTLFLLVIKHMYSQKSILWPKRSLLISTCCNIPKKKLNKLFKIIERNNYLLKKKTYRLILNLFYL